MDCSNACCESIVNGSGAKCRVASVGRQRQVHLGSALSKQLRGGQIRLDRAVRAKSGNAIAPASPRSGECLGVRFSARTFALTSS